jgi:protoporphyrinogen oxidase
MGGEIRFNEKVNKITLADNKITSVNGAEYDYIFSSMPINDLVTSMNDVPGEMQEIAKGLPYRDFITVGLLLKSVKIEATDNWIYIQEPDVLLGRLQIFNNWSPYLVKDKDKLWIGLEYFCSEGDEMWNMGDKEFIELAIGELEKIGVIEASEVLDATRINVKKAYPAYFDSYSEFPKLRTWLGTIDNLFCIGRNGQHRYNNMDHSMRTAIEAVKVITAGAPKSKVWEVNTEEEYHEEKAEEKAEDKIEEVAHA